MWHNLSTFSTCSVKVKVQPTQKLNRRTQERIRPRQAINSPIDYDQSLQTTIFLALLPVTNSHVQVTFPFFLITQETIKGPSETAHSMPKNGKPKKKGKRKKKENNNKQQKLPHNRWRDFEYKRLLSLSFYHEKAETQRPPHQCASHHHHHPHALPFSYIEFVISSISRNISALSAACRFLRVCYSVFCP